MIKAYVTVPSTFSLTAHALHRLIKCSLAAPACVHALASLMIRFCSTFKELGTAGAEDRSDGHTASAALTTCYAGTYWSPAAAASVVDGLHRTALISLVK